jgi:choline dehydrogenase-like flavoprotein
MRIPHLKDHPLHGTTGPMTCEFFRYSSPLTEIYLEAARELNMLNPNNDLNGETQSGFSRSQGTIRDGLRCSTSKAYLRPVRHRDNLHISTKSHVEKILINPETKQAYGVLFRKENKKYAVFATKEVILSAGAIQSPQLLMLSGVGPQSHLKEHDIEVIHHSPGVGENLQGQSDGKIYSMNRKTFSTLNFT